MCACCVQSCEGRLHPGSCHGICALLKTCDMCTLYSNDNIQLTNNRPHTVTGGGQGIPNSAHSTPDSGQGVAGSGQGMADSGHGMADSGHGMASSGLPAVGQCVWCVKEAVCYHRDGIHASYLQ